MDFRKTEPQIQIDLGEYIDRMFPALLQRAAAAIPSQCGFCHAWPADSVCEDCVVQFAQPVPRCHSCALPLPAAATSPGLRCGQCLQTPPPLDACVAAVAYEFPWPDLIHRFKFGKQPGLAAMIARLIRSTPWAEPALDKANLVVPMPLAAPRLQLRGYNQAQALARALAPSRIDSAALWRIKDTPAQTSLQTRAGRLASMKDAFAVDPLRTDVIKGKRIVVVDDVMTTGASMFSAASALRAAGAAHVTGLVFARTGL